MAVAGYAPEMLLLFQKASQNELKIKCKNEKDAHRLRYRLHNLRKDMRLEKHYLLSVAEGVSLHIEDDILIAKPVDDFHVQALREAGLELEEPTPPTEAELNTQRLSVSDALGEFMNKEDK